MDAAAIRERIKGLSWWHSIDLPHGVVTPGRWGPPARIIVDAFNGVDFRERKVLDVGCLDGLWSFEAERRGAATVIATDLVSQLGYAAPPTLLTAKEILGSRVEYFPDVSVFDAPHRFPSRDFDVVVFCGVFYHLKDPLLALARLRQVLRTGGVIIVEGDVLDDDEGCYASFHYRDVHKKDESNWWVPTARCLREWVTCSFFDVLSEHRSPSYEDDSRPAPPQRWWKASRGSARYQRMAACRAGRGTGRSALQLPGR